MAENRRLVSIGKLACNSFLLLWLKRRVTGKSLIEQDWLSGLQVYDSILNHNMRQKFLLFIFLRFPARNKETLKSCYSSYVLSKVCLNWRLISFPSLYLRPKKSPCWPRDYFSVMYIPSFNHSMEFYAET